MARITTLLIVGLAVGASSFMLINDNANFIPVPQESFQRGEILDYKINYGIFSIGTGTMKISDRLYKMNYRDCYKIDLFGKTSGIVSMVSKIDDQWGSYVDTAALIPHMVYRNIKEGNYRKNEVTRFDHNMDIIEVKTVDKKTGKFKEPIIYQAPDNVRDMLGGFLYMRAFDFDTIPAGSTFFLNGFMEDTFYNMEVIYAGIEEVKTKAGKIKCHKIIPVMPKNKLFNGENSITAYLSADENKIPVLVEANMFIGSASVELTGFSGLKNPLDIR